VADLAVWAAGLTPVYLEGALDRALRLAQQVPLTARLTDAEYEALDDAERLEAAAESSVRLPILTSRRKDGSGRRRTDSGRASRRRRCASSDTRRGGKVEAKMHEKAPRAARAIAADAKRRLQSVKAEAAPGTHPKRRAANKTK
jgi:hypothetical protein